MVSNESKWEMMKMNAASIDDHELLELSIARQVIIPKRREKPVSPTTVWRWHKKGCSGVCLQFRYVGNKPYLSRAMFNEFIEQVTAARANKPVAQADDVTDEELREAGLN
jgi:hypothetical protein